MINPEVNYDCFNDSSRRQFGGVTLLFAQMMYYRATMKAEHFLKLIRSRHKVSFGLICQITRRAWAIRPSDSGMGATVGCDDVKLNLESATLIILFHCLLGTMVTFLSCSLILHLKLNSI